MTDPDAHPELAAMPLLRAALTAAENPAVIGADEQAGIIGLVDGRTDSPLCFCGSRNLHSCDAAGEPMAIGDKWPGLFACDSCGRLVDGNTRAVVGASAPPAKQKVEDEPQVVGKQRGRISAALDRAIGDAAHLVGR